MNSWGNTNTADCKTPYYLFFISFILLFLSYFKLHAQKELLVNLKSIDSSFVIDLRYTSENNFLKQKLYDFQEAYLLAPVAQKLLKAHKILINRGYYLKIWDAYRPHSFQYKMWERVPDPRYVANPQKGSHHNRGCAVDVTLVDSSGREVVMPTGYDDFSVKAHLDFTNLPDSILFNRELLQQAMKQAGFLPLSTEWWHFSDPECEKYPILDNFPGEISGHERSDH